MKEHTDITDCVYINDKLECTHPNSKTKKKWFKTIRKRCILERENEFVTHCVSRRMHVVNLHLEKL